MSDRAGNLPRPCATLTLVFLTAFPCAAMPGQEAVRHSESPRYNIVGLDAPPGCRKLVEPRAINNHGEVVGVAHRTNGPYFAFRYHDRKSDALSAPQSEAWDINDRAQDAGFMPSADNTTRAMLWQPSSDKNHATPSDLGACIARALNCWGQIVGACDDGFLWTQSQTGGISGVRTRMQPQGLGMNTLIPAGSGWLLTEARATNDEGQIIGIGTRDGEEMAFKLTLTVQRRSDTGQESAGRGDGAPSYRVVGAGPVRRLFRYF